MNIKSKVQSPKSKVQNLKSLRKGQVFCFLLSSLFLLLLVSLAYADGQRVSSSELVERPKKYDGKKVTFRGEVVGDVMIRGDYAWININDGSYGKKSIEEGGAPKGYNSGQSIWVKAEEARKISRAGNYRGKGDIVEVEGIFHRACREHGGDMDIHGDRLRVVKRGYSFDHFPDGVKIFVALGLSLATAILFVMRRWRLKSLGTKS